MKLVMTGRYARYSFGMRSQLCSQLWSRMSVNVIGVGFGNDKLSGSFKTMRKNHMLAGNLQTRDPDTEA